LIDSDKALPAKPQGDGLLCTTLPEYLPNPTQCNAMQCNDDEKRRLMCMNHGGDQFEGGGRKCSGGNDDDDDDDVGRGVLLVVEVVVVVVGHPSLLDPGLPDR
jgi:hypothetical protein